jgi:hypothetical protein
MKMVLGEENGLILERDEKRKAFGISNASQV